MPFTVFARLASANDDLGVLGIDGCVVAFAQPAVEDGGGQPVTDLALDDPFERPGAERGLVALLGQQRGRSRGDNVIT